MRVFLIRCFFADGEKNYIGKNHRKYWGNGWVGSTQTTYTIAEEKAGYVGEDNGQLVDIIKLSAVFIIFSVKQGLN